MFCLKYLLECTLPYCVYFVYVLGFVLECIICLLLWKFLFLYVVDLCCTRVYIVLYSVDFMYKVCVESIYVELEFTLSCIASFSCALFNVYGILEYTLLYIVSILCTLFVFHQFVLKCTLSCNVSILLICIFVLYNLA